MTMSRLRQTPGASIDLPVRRFKLAVSPAQGHALALSHSPCRRRRHHHHFVSVDSVRNVIGARKLLLLLLYPCTVAAARRTTCSVLVLQAHTICPLHAATCPIDRLAAYRHRSRQCEMTTTADQYRITCVRNAPFINALSRPVPRLLLILPSPRLTKKSPCRLCLFLLHLGLHTPCQLHEPPVHSFSTFSQPGSPL
ncbi:hypothetical protein IWX90DRAFT_53127 [Phyllosticta citrichinensis]|uniref:Uncharacterized protein n=1 Tax=Phyllosticta citrichinensis TaxID=1130410 RepID=A0ABR1XIN5_9PEZI